MSSPQETQIHPTSLLDGKSEGREETMATEKPNHITNNRAWLEGDSRSSSKSLGPGESLQDSALNYTCGFSSEEDSDSEGLFDLNTSRGMTRSLGRKEMSCLMRKSSNQFAKNKLIPVSQRSAAYKEMISSSQNSRKGIRQSPQHSGLDGSDNSPVRTRIEMNPFFQLDKQALVQPGTCEQQHNTPPAHLKKDTRMNSPASPSISSARSPTISGMSVQMRIKSWEKERGAKAAASTILTHRRSLQPASLLKTDSNKEEPSKNNLECSAHSDDETIKNILEESFARPVRENIYEEITDTQRIKEASSSSSESSPVPSPPQSKASKSKNGSPKASKKGTKVDSPDLNQKRSKWKLKSPLQKRKNKMKKARSKDDGKVASESPPSPDMSYNQTPATNTEPSIKNKELSFPKSKSKSEDEVVDDVFSPVSPGVEKGLQQKVEGKALSTNAAEGCSGQSGGPPSSIRPRSAPTRTISREILHIIGSLGSSDDAPSQRSTPTVLVDVEEVQSGDSESGSEEESAAQSSLDVGSCARQALKRRASDSYRTQHGVSQEGRRKTSLYPREQNAESLIATALMYADAVWDREAQDIDELSIRVGNAIEILDMTDDVWWHGSAGDASGWFPAAFVRLRVGQDSDSEDSDSEPTTKVRVVPDPGDEELGAKDPCSSTSERLAMDQLQRLSDPKLNSAPLSPSKSCDKEVATLPRNFPRQQAGTTRRRMTIRRKDPSASTLPKKLSPEQVRTKIVEEIISTEQDYVKHLEDIIEGYLKRCREYNKLFDEEQIEVIFSNINQVYSFQKDFLKELEARVKPGHMAESEIGEVFVLNQHEFKVYSQYCNNHPHAVSEMSSLQKNEQYSFFFESCRLLRNLQDISLEGFLLTPVQKICKYPLQLSELLKYTSEDHPDHAHVVAAQKAMKEVAMLINEQKRRIENMGKIGCWQKTIEGWKGPSVLETSTEMIHCGELHKISKGHSQERHFFLFDHQLVYCKKDTIGGKLGYKGRVDLDHCQIADITDSSVLHGNTPIKNCWRMNNKAKDNKWYIIYTKSSQLKEEWMKAFERERVRVLEDADKGFHVSLKMKRAAVALCANSVDSRRRLKSVKKHVAFSESADGPAGSKKLAMTMSSTVSSSQTAKKTKTAKRKLHSVSGTSSAKVIF